jgi:alkylhydroperoxidase family enzyme
MKEDEIAALDGDWAEFTPAERAAYAYARKLSFEPHRITSGDIDRLRKHYTDLQILEMTLSIAGNNSINRWKEGAGIPQSKDGGGFRKRAAKADKTEKADANQPLPKDRPLPIETYLTPTSEKYKDRVTKVAPLAAEEGGLVSRLAVCRRPPSETREEVEQALAACRKRSPRLPLVDEAKARELLPTDWPEGPLPQWLRLLANFPVHGKSQITSIRSAEEKGDLQPLFKAQVSWIIARQDRAWYAAGLAKQRLKELGCSDDQVYQLDDESWEAFTPAQRAMFTLAKKLAASPIVLTDADVAQALKATGPREVVQLIRYTTTRASFDRITEAAGLQLEK